MLFSNFSYFYHENVLKSNWSKWRRQTLVRLPAPLVLYVMQPARLLCSAYAERELK